MVEQFSFGILPDGRKVSRYRIHGGENAWVDVLDFGGTVQSIVVPDRNGMPTDVVLGYDTLEGYRQGGCFFGGTIGRHANRMGGARFTLNGETYTLKKNDWDSNLHSGPEGYEKRLFTGEICGDSLKLHLVSPHMDQGFPGALHLTVTFTFSRENLLTIHYGATCDRDTVVNLTNHSYFDLSGGKNPMGQRLSMTADRFCEGGEHTLPTGRTLPVEGTPFDFRREKPVGQDVDAPADQLTICGGYDHNYVLPWDGTVKTFATLHSPETGIVLTAATDMPGAQFYSGNWTEGLGKGGKEYARRSGVCLESQFFPNAMAVEGWMKPILRAGEVYDHTTSYGFSVE